MARFQIASPEVKIAITNLPTAIENLRIVQLSDVHLGTGPGVAHVNEMVNQALALNPDIIALTGDIIDGNISEIQAEILALSRLNAKYGVYFILGNHEAYWNWKEAVEALTQIGFIPLLNEGKIISIAQSSIFIAGINDPTLKSMGGEGPKIPTPPAESDLNIALMHQPQFAEEVARILPAYHLQLSGHTHAGQFFPWNYVVDRMYPVAKGLGKISNLWVYVNPGTGYWGPPIRLGTTAEVSHLVLIKS